MLCMCQALQLHFFATLHNGYECTHPRKLNLRNDRPSAKLNCAKFPYALSVGFLTMSVACSGAEFELFTLGQTDNVYATQ